MILSHGPVSHRKETKLITPCTQQTEGLTYATDQYHIEKKLNSLLPVHSKQNV